MLAGKQDILILILYLCWVTLLKFQKVHWAFFLTEIGYVSVVTNFTCQKTRNHDHKTFYILVPFWLFTSKTRSDFH